MLWSSRFLVAALLAALTPDVPAPEPSQGLPFFDGYRTVVATRVGPMVDRPALTAVRLDYPGYNLRIDAAIDRTAIVELAAGESVTLLDRHGLQVVRPLAPDVGLYLVADPAGSSDGLDIAARLRNTPGIASAIPNLYLERTRFAAFTPDDPSFGAQWYFDRLDMTAAWGMELGDPTVVITVVDSGCDLAHPDLASKMEPGKDTVSDDDDPSPNPADSSGAHGTACAGIIAAQTNNALGIAGACPDCRLSCVRMLGAPGELIPLDNDVQAFNFAKQSGAAVVSNSWGFVSAFPVPTALAAAINDVFDNGRGGLGAAVIFAAGNEDREVSANELLGVRGVLGVGAINNYYDSTVYTNFGAPVDIVAPTGTMTTDISGNAGYDPGDYTTTFGGTSSACPVAAGIAALLISADPTLTAAEVHDLMIQTAIQAPYAAPDANGHDPVFGYGIVNPVGALQDVLGVPGGTGGTGGAGGAGGVGGAGGAAGAGGSGGSGSGGAGGTGAGGGASGAGGAGGEGGTPGGGCAAVPGSCAWLLPALLLLGWRRRG